MPVIWKKNLPMLPGTFDIRDVSCHARVLAVEKQHGKPVIYFENEPSADQEFKLRVVAVLTGSDVPPNHRYLNSLMFENDSLVIHYFIPEFPR